MFPAALTRASAVKLSACMLPVAVTVPAFIKVVADMLLAATLAADTTSPVAVIRPAVDILAAVKLPDIDTRLLVLSKVNPALALARPESLNITSVLLPLTLILPVTLPITLPRK